MKSLLSLLALILLLSSCNTTQKTPVAEAGFDKLIYHTSVCFGFCPVYHLEIQRDRQFRVYVERSFQRDSANRWLPDSSHTGYFMGTLNERSLAALDSLVNQTGLRNLKPDSTLCCDGSLKTVIGYFNGKRTYYQTMFPNERMQALLELLKNIAADEPRRRTAPFDIEE